MTRTNNSRVPGDNRDPITGEPGAHPVGVGVGAASGGVIGAAAGSPVGPIGAVVGAGVGAVAGGLAGKAVAEDFDPTAEDAYWASNYNTRPYADRGVGYTVYQPAYRYGWESARRYSGRRFGDVEPTLREGWDKARGSSTLAWEKAKDAVRDAWDRITGRPTARG